MAQYQIDNMPSPINFEEKDPIRRTLQNAKNLLMCRVGEVPYDRCRGINPELFDLPIGELKAEILPELDLLMSWEPDVEVADAEVSLIDNGQLYIKAILEIDIDE